MSSPQNPYDFSEFNKMIDSSLSQLRSINKEHKINIAVFNSINKYLEHCGLSILDIPEVDFLMDTLTEEIMKITLK